VRWDPRQRKVYVPGRSFCGEQPIFESSIIPEEVPFVSRMKNPIIHRVKPDDAKEIILDDWEVQWKQVCRVCIKELQYEENQWTLDR
jgi:hypothetical protein